MGDSNTGSSQCSICGAVFRLFTIHNRDMQGLCKVWRSRHERGCQSRTPAQRRAWAKKYEGKDTTESSLTVDLSHEGFQDCHPAEDPIDRMNSAQSHLNR